MLTLKADCDLDRLAEKLAGLGVTFDRGRKAMPLGETEKSVTVTVEGGKIPEAVKGVEGVVKVSPSSKLKMF